MTLPLFPARPRPFDDELLTSWCFRLAQANGVSFAGLIYACSPYLHHASYDLDRNLPPEVRESLLARSGLEPELFRTLTLDAYPETHLQQGSRRQRWILPVAFHNRRHQAHGLQACPDCLAEDDVPYFRRFWRLAFAVTCPRHERMLLDRCPACEVPLDFRSLGATRKHDSLYRGPACCCWRCGFDLREVAFTSYDAQEVHDLGGRLGKVEHGVRGKERSLRPVRLRRVAEFQSWLQQGLKTGTVPWLGRDRPVAEVLSGVYQLLHLLSVRREGGPFRRAVGELNWTLRSRPEVNDTQGVWFGRLDLNRRLLAMEAASWIMEGWPERFHAVCERARANRPMLLGEYDPDTPVWWLDETLRYHGQTRLPWVAFLPPLFQPNTNGFKPRVLMPVASPILKSHFDTFNQADV